MENGDKIGDMSNGGIDQRIEPSNMPDNRNVIRLEELRGESEGESKKLVKPEDESEINEERYLDDPEIRNLIYSERGKIPSVILDDIYENLKGRRVSKNQLKKIIYKVKENLDTESKIEKIDDLYKKLDALEKLLRNFSKRSQIESTDDEKLKDFKDPENKDLVIEPEIVEKVNSEVQEPEISKLGRFEESPRSPEGSIESIQEVSDDNGGGVKMETVNKGFLEKNALEGDGQKTNGIRLAVLPLDSKRIIFLLKWIEYLVERVGYEELENALDYYVDIGWISEDVLFSILRYAKGIKLYHEKSDWRPVGYLNIQDHIMSLMFIEALRTGKFSREKIMEVEREVFRMKREAMELNGI